MASTDAMRRELAAITGATHVRAPRAEELEDATRWTGLRGRADLLVAPGDAEQLAAVVAWAYAGDVPITTRGGGTGLAGGAVPDGGIVLATERLTRVRALDPQWWRAEVEAGVPTAELQRRAAEAGLRYPVDPGAAATSLIGGNLATNAGGPASFGHGVTRDWTLSVEAVLAPGELVRTGGPLRKDVAGYDLTGLLVGSEGTLGVITAAWLRLIPPPAAQSTVLALFSTPAGAQDGLAAAHVSGARPVSLELFDGGTLADTSATLPIPGAAAAWRALPAPAAGVLLIAGLEGDADDDVHARAAALQAEWADAGAGWTAQTGEQGGRAAGGLPAALAAWRSGVSGAVAARRGGKLSEDVAVPADRVGELLEGSAAIAAAHRLEHATWGHAGDGNLHCSLLIDAADPAARSRAQAAADALFTLAIGLGGTISGEHGLGRLKSGRLRDQWSPAAVAAHTAIRRALDPKGLFNPGRKLA